MTSCIMSVITVRVSKELREKMMRRKDVNWSEVVRQSIERRLTMEDRIAASEQLDRVRGSAKPVKEDQIRQWIREDRRR